MLTENKKMHQIEREGSLNDFSNKIDNRNHERQELREN